MIMKSLLLILSFITIYILSTSCETTKIDEMVFIGDSIIAKWDVAEEFPTWITDNLGKSGCSVSFLDKYAGKMQGKKVTILVGTNDMTGLTETSRDTYERDYINSILSLQASHVYLFSVLPRFTDPYDITCNINIKEFNNSIKKRIKQCNTISYIDVFDDFFADSNIITSLYEPDGLHINNEGYAVLREKLLAVILE